MTPRIPSLAVTGLLLCPIVSAETLVIEEAAESARLIVTAWQADIRVSASPGARLTVDCRCADGNPAPLVGDGLRSVAARGAPELLRNDDKITLKLGESDGRCIIDIAAPAGLDPELRINDRGSVDVSDRKGNVTVWVAEGDVRLTGQRGPFSVTAMSGDATVELVGDTLEEDSAITAANGLVTLWLAGEPAVTLRAQARWGDVRTDVAARFAVENRDGANWSVAKLGSGGAAVTLRNLNSDVLVRAGAAPRD